MPSCTRSLSFPGGIPDQSPANPVILHTYLTTFAGGFLVLPAPVHRNYVFDNADFSKDKTIYLTVIGLVVLYILFTIYARYKDKKDMEKVRRLHVLNDSSFSLVGINPNARQ